MGVENPLLFPSFLARVLSASRSCSLYYSPMPNTGLHSRSEPQITRREHS